MKRKIFSVLMTMVLVLSLGVVFAAPAAANGVTIYPCYTLGVSGDSGDSNTSEWSTYQSIVGPYSARLHYEGGDTAYIEFTPEPGTFMTDLATIVGSFWYRHESDTQPGPIMGLRFTSPDCVNPNGAGHVDVTVDTALAAPAFGIWTNEQVTSTSTAFYFGNDPTDGTRLNGGFGSPSMALSAILGHVNGTAEMLAGTPDTADAWQLTRVSMVIGWTGTERDCFIDDITMDGFTYDMEPFNVDVTGPAEDVYVCQDFEVTATIKNRGNEASNFKAIIDPGLNAEWVSGGDADLSDHPQREAIVQPCETWTVSWMLHCTDPTPTTVTVKAKCDQATDWIENTTTVTQVDPALAVAITSIDSQLVGENFVVTATVTSTGPNTDVVATIDLQSLNAEWISGGDPDQTGYPIPIGDMADGDTANVSWTLRCTAAGDTTIIVSATSDEVTTPVTDDQVVTQTTPDHPILTADGAVTVVPSGPFHPGQTFSVDAIITNDGDEPALDCSATISFSNELAGLVTGDSVEKDLGNIQPGAEHHANWTVICNGAGSTTITVTPAGDDDVTGESIVAADLISGSATAVQIPIDGLTVAISGPVAGTQYGPTQTFNVTGTVTNTGASAIEGATATIVVGGGDNASVTGNTTVTIGDLAKGASEAFSWGLTCTGVDVGDPPDYTTITVNASGTSEKTGETVEGSDDTWVYQKYLVVEITEPTDPFEACVGTETYVSFTVTNWYTEALPTPEATIVFDETVLELDFGESATINLDALLIGEPSEQYHAWHVKCLKAELGSTLTVYVSDIVAGVTISNRDVITVNQYAGADLDVVSEPETCQWVGYGETFVVSATVTNNGDATATGVTADLSLAVEDEAVGTGDGTTDVFYLDYPPIVGDSEDIYVDAVLQTEGTHYTIDDTTGEITFATAPGSGIAITADYTNNGITIVSGADPQTIGTLLAGGSGTATWTVRCISFCDVPITVIAEGTDVCGAVTGSNLEIVHQLPLEVVVASQEAVETCTTFCVTAKIWNRTCLCGEVAPFDVTGVTATITFAPTSGASLVTGELATKTIGTVYRCQSQEVEWTVHCDSIGEVDITVTATTSTTPITGDPLTYTVSTSDLITVEQIRSLIRYDVPLAKGWNYMSLPLIPEDSDIAKVLAPIATQYNNVWRYVAGEWKLYAPSVPITEFTTMTDGVGYAIRVINPAVLTGQGYELPTELYVLPPEYALQQGWNLVGFKTMDFVDPVGTIDNLDTMAAQLYLGNLQVSGGEARIIGDEARFLRTYLPGIGWRVLTDSDLMLVGKGYWLYVSLEDLSIVPPIER